MKDRAPVPVGVGRYLGAGLTWALATLLFLGAGAWVGERLGIRSVGALIGAFVGAAAGLYWMVRQLTPEPAEGTASRRPDRTIREVGGDAPGSDRAVGGDEGNRPATDDDMRDSGTADGDEQRKRDA